MLCSVLLRLDYILHVIILPTDLLGMRILLNSIRSKSNSLLVYTFNTCVVVVDVNTLHTCRTRCEYTVRHSYGDVPNVDITYTFAGMNVNTHHKVSEYIPHF